MEENKRLYPISEEFFNQKILPIIEGDYIGKGRPPKVSHYQAFCGILYILRTDCPRRDLPPEYGYWHTIVGCAVIADRGYDSNEFRRELAGNNNEPVIPGRKNRKEVIVYNKEKYKKRGLIERLFGKVKENRRLVVRYEKSDITFLGFIIIAFLKILLC
ncbi:MAG: transposase [Treponema sp.]|jgi:transposase|nr:transposase [Treponema sp.]